MKRNLMLLATTFIFSSVSVISTFAGQWQQDQVGWWYDYNFSPDFLSYPESQWEVIDGKEYYFDDDGYMVYNTTIDGFALGADGARIIYDIGLEIAPNKSQIDHIISNNWDIYQQGDFGMSAPTDASGNINWIDCGTYYKLNDVTLYYVYHTGEYLDTKTLGYLSEVRVRKDGKYIYYGKYNASTGELSDEVMSLYEWIHSDEWYTKNNLPRYGVLFDEKGYITSFWDVNAG